MNMTKISKARRIPLKEWVNHHPNTQVFKIKREIYFGERKALYLSFIISQIKSIYKKIHKV